MDNKEVEPVYLSPHYPPGPRYQCYQKYKALLNMESNELKSIYHLVESHSPSLRMKAAYRYNKLTTELDNKQVTLNAENIDFNCKTNNTDDINNMLRQIKEMPKEWTIIQLTTAFNAEEVEVTYTTKECTNPIHISVFSCGKGQPSPICVTADAPIDESGNVMNIKQEMSSIIHDNKECLMGIKKFKGPMFKTQLDKNMYSESRVLLNNRLKNLVREIQDYWLKEWRCLLIGKLNDDEEDYINIKLDCLLKQLKGFEVTDKIRYILKCVIKASSNLKLAEIVNVLHYCFPNNKAIHLKFGMFIKDLSVEKYYAGLRRHPVILIVDEALDAFPWEMLDVLKGHPVSRMPSLHFTYALFKEHEDSIEDGIKTNIDPNKGMFIINPGLDLKQMEMRLHNFFRYWTPNWTGLVGITPSCTEFKDILLKSDIFSYNGHGNGSQFFSGDKIQKLRINSVVLLFGCSSVKNTYLGPQVEMYGSHQMYLIACSPCVVGMLWEVTDCDTDTFATEFWSRWLPCKTNVQWKNIDRKKWETTGEIVSKPGVVDNQINKHEPELLRALSNARKGARQFLTQAACVARGIPVKIKC